MNMNRHDREFKVLRYVLQLDTEASVKQRVRKGVVLDESSWMSCIDKLSRAVRTQMLP